MSLLQVCDLRKSYQQRDILMGLSFEVKSGEIVGLLGPNGAGKTTAFYIAMGLIPPASGCVRMNGEDITPLPVHSRVDKGMGYLAQEPSVFRSLTVKDNLLLILEALPFTASERQAKLEQLLQELHLTPLANKKAGTLSGGERRRLEITRALIRSPQILLLDEPFANIDPISIAEVQQLIHELKRRGISVLITDHNAREIFAVVDRSYVIQQGSVIAEGTSEALLENEQVRHTYLGAHFKI